MIKVTVKFFLFARQAGQKECVFALPEEATLADLTARIGRQFPKLAPLVDQATYLVNQSGGTRDTRLKHGDEVVMLQVHAGG